MSLYRDRLMPQPQTSAGWRDVYDSFTELDLRSLPSTDAERLAEASFWLGRPNDAILARQRAYAAHRDSGDVSGAIRNAWMLFYHHFDLDQTAAAGGWLKRAQRHLRGSSDAVLSGYVALAEADWALYAGDLETALAQVRRATDTAREHADLALEALGLATEGRIQVTRGEVADGLALLDEAMVACAGGDLPPFIMGWVYCLLLYTCHMTGDMRRAAEWTDLAMRWCERNGEQSWYPGLCRLHRCEVVAMRGEWTVAEGEAVRAAEELVALGEYMVGESHYLCGELRRLRGDLEGAEEAFRQAHGRGRDPQPGMALLRLAQGNSEGAASALRVALAAGAEGPLVRARLLAADVRVELRLGLLDLARNSAAELEEIAAGAGTLLLRGMAATARGAVQLAEDDVEAALASLRVACGVYRELSCPYEGAEAQVLLGVAARRSDDESTARLELEAARATFARLGAVPDAERADALLAVAASRPRGLTAREVEVLALVARGRTNRAIASELFISEHTVARHLTNIFHKIGVTSRSAATAFAFEHGLA